MQRKMPAANGGHCISKEMVVPNKQERKDKASVSAKKSSQGQLAKSNSGISNALNIMRPQHGNACFLDNVFWVKYPHEKTIFMHFDVDGDLLDVHSHKIIFSECCTVITRLSKMPEILCNAHMMFELIGQGGCHTKDTYSELMQQEIENRKEKGAALVDEEGFERRATVTLPYPVEPHFYDKDMRKRNKFTVTVTNEGSAFINFWLKIAG